MMVLFVLLAALAVLYGVYRMVCRRHREKNCAADFDGFVFSQRMPPFSTLRYGFFRADYNGCGVVAAVNASRILGKPVHPADIISDFERFGAVLFGLFGTSALAVSHYFRKRGCRIQTTCNQAQMDDLAKTAAVSVLWYVHRRGAHFVTLQPTETGFLAYNAGRRNGASELSSLEAFLNQRALFACLFAISPDERK